MLVHPAHFRRRPRQVDEELAALMDSYARRSAGSVGKDIGSGGNHGLTLLIFRQLPAGMMLLHPLAYAFDDVGVIFQRRIHDFGADDFRHIALRRPETTRRDDDIGPRQGRAEYLFHPLGIIADRRVVYDGIAEPIEFFRQIPRILVDDFSEQQLRARRNEFY